LTQYLDFCVAETLAIKLFDIYSKYVYTTNYKKRCAEATTPKFNSENIMSNKTRSNNGGEHPQPNASDDKVNIAIPRRVVNLLSNAVTQISISMLVYSFGPYLPSAQPKQLSACPTPQPIQVTPKTSRS